MKKISITIIIFFLILLAAGLVFNYNKEREKTWTINQEESDLDLSIEENAEEMQQEKTFHPDSIPAMREKEFQGDDLELGQVLAENESYTRHYITYISEGLKISGIMNVPKGAGPFPVLLLNHGFIEPSVYTNGRGLKREQDHLARQGYVIIHSDYRNHADSDFDPENDVRPRSGYVEDILNLISAVQKSELEFLDKERMGMLGHSMGGGIAINVMAINPEPIKAYVLLAPINAEYKKNFERWVAPEWPELAREVLDTYGTFEENPEFWKSVSAINYLGDVDDPVQLHQGTADPDVPLEWSQDLAGNLEDAEKDITYHEYFGDGHSFLKNFSTVIGRATSFFDEHLK